MPKIIEGLREKILATSREMLLGTGYEALTIRAVAKCCGVAVGTVYNYFPSKDVLIASIMLDDWRQVLNRMRQETGNAASISVGLKSIFDGLMAFSATYRKAWSQYTATGGALSALQERHGMLLDQLSGMIMPMVVRLGGNGDSLCVEIAVNSLLNYSQREITFGVIEPALIKLLS